jgi:4'-phosphopantetheinyl transferase
MPAILSIIGHEDVPAAEEFLSQTEAADYASFKLEKRRVEWLSARFAAKKAYFELEPDSKLSLKQVEVAKASTGEPYLLVEGSRYGAPLSLSHSGGYAVAVIGRNCRAIGVDIEKIEDRPQCWADDSFHPAEIPPGAGADHYTELWAKKEAVLKALGIGLSADLYDIRFEGGSHKPILFNRACRAWQSKGSGKFAIRIYSMPQGYVTCVVTLD